MAVAAAHLGVFGAQRIAGLPVIEVVDAAAPIHHHELAAAMIAVALTAVVELVGREPPVIALVCRRAIADLGVTFQAQAGRKLLGAFVTLAEAEFDAHDDVRGHDEQQHDREHDVEDSPAVPIKRLSRC